MRNFDADFNRMQRFNSIFFKFVFGCIAFVFIMMICWFIFLGVFVVKAADKISSDGAKSLVEQFWCGENKDCKLPAVTK